jgi:signal transduction histidine kinase
MLAGLAILSIIGFILYRNNRQKQKANKVLEKTLTNLKSTQAQLIQSEKMASLGELTAGIAHEIQNPLNFVNNFSEVSVDLAKELKEELENLEIPEKDKEYVSEIISDLSSNQEKINHHGKRASDIVKGMFEHSRTSTGQKEATDINALCDEYLRLAYHGLKAKDNNFNATTETHFDPNLPKIDIIPQDIGRVLLNLINNAFYAVNERKNLLNLAKQSGDANLTDLAYKPTVSISTQLTADNQLEIAVKDNGSGIPAQIKDKIFQPFFTTKPTGQGTGLGLSLSYDIIKAHGGELRMESKEGEGSEFVIHLPIVN